MGDGRDLYWVHLPRGTIGLTAKDGTVTTAHESIAWAVGKPLADVEAYARGYGGDVEMIAPATEECAGPTKGSDR